MKRFGDLCVLVLCLGGCASVEVAERKDPESLQGTAVDESVFETLGEYSRPEKPEGLSGVARAPDGRYFTVDDRGGMAYEVSIDFDQEGSEGVFGVLREMKLGGRRDLEGCAFDSLTGWLWVSDESDTTVNAYDSVSGAFKAMLALPPIYQKEVRKNLSLEALTISADGTRLYVANEDTLKCDGEVANREHGGMVRVQEFKRGSAAERWMPSRQFFYPTDPIEGEPYRKLSLSTLVAMAVEESGALLMLEREMSVKNGLFPTCRGRIYRVLPPADGAVAAKTLVWEEDTGFANYEGMCFGPKLADGSRTLVLVSDGGGPAAENFCVLKESKP